VEYDDIELFGGSDPIMDMEVFVTRTADDAPGAYEVTYAYTNVADSLPGTVGVEGPAGAAATAVNSSLVADGLIVCFDWTGPSLDPIVISYDVTVDADAEFGVHTNSVVSATSNPGSVATSAAVDVEVMDTPAATLAAYVDQLAAWVNNPAADLSAEDVARLLAAHDHLVRAMTPGRWVNETTLDAATGRASFGDMKRAVGALGHLTKGTSLHRAKNEIKRGLVKVSELLADVAYQQAVASGLADEADLQRALLKMAKADRMQSRYRWKEAIRKSRGAWVASVQHLLG
jgi:hypothetical protein